MERAAQAMLAPTRIAQHSRFASTACATLPHKGMPAGVFQLLAKRATRRRCWKSDADGRRYRLPNGLYARAPLPIQWGRQFVTRRKREDDGEGQRYRRPSMGRRLSLLLACSRMTGPQQPSPASPETGASVNAVAGVDRKGGDCAAPEGTRVAERRGGAIYAGDKAVRVYRAHDGCWSNVATISPDGPLAFVHADEGRGEMPSLIIETWLFHGDRAAQQCCWIAGTYFSVARWEIPGPHRTNWASHPEGEMTLC